MIIQEEIITIGKFQKTHALKGELNMISDIDPEYFLEGNPLIVNNDGILVPYYVESVRPKGATSYLVKISGIETEEEASHFINKEIGIVKKDAEEWLEEEIIDSNEIIGYKVVDIETDKEIGIIENIDDSTVNLLFIIKDENGEQVYIPANEELIEEIDEGNKVIKMIIPEGLIDLNKKEKDSI